MGTPRVVWRFETQVPVSYLDVWTDSDHAGCTKMRRSTSAAAVMAGHHLLRHSSTTQTVVALSFGRARVLRECEKTRAGIANRRGAGRVRIAHPCSSKLDGDANVADFGMNRVGGKRMLRLVGDVRIVKLIGRSELSLRVSGETMA